MFEVTDAFVEVIYKILSFEMNGWREALLKSLISIALFTKTIDERVNYIKLQSNIINKILLSHPDKLNMFIMKEGDSFLKNGFLQIIKEELENVCNNSPDFVRILSECDPKTLKNICFIDKVVDMDSYNNWSFLGDWLSRNVNDSPPSYYSKYSLLKRWDMLMILIVPILSRSNICASLEKIQKNCSIFYHRIEA